MHDTVILNLETDAAIRERDRKMHSKSKLALAMAVGALGAAVGSKAYGQNYDPNTSFVYLSSNLPDGSNQYESSGGQSLLVPMGINNSGLITGYYRAYQWTGQITGGSPTGVVISTSSNVAAPGITTSLTQVTGVTSVDGNPSDLPTSNGYPSGNGDDNWGFGINAAGTVAGAGNGGEWPSVVTPSLNPAFGTYSSRAITQDGLPLVTASQSGETSQPNGPFGGGNFTSPPSGLGMAINNAGDVVGGAFTAPFGTKQMHAMIDPVGTNIPMDLNGYVPNAVASIAYGVDPNGNTSTGNATLVGVSTPYRGASLNVGKYQKSATVWTETNGTWTAQTLPSLYTGGSGTSVGQSIAYGVARVNGNQEVVGVSDTTGSPVATLWVNGVPQNLDGIVSGGHSSIVAPFGSSMESVNAFADANPKDYFANQALDLQSVADAINSSGDIVGYTDIFPGEGKTAVLYTPSGGIIDLNNYLPASIAAEYPGAYLEEATGINSSGQIVGYGEDTAAAVFGFELNPIGASVPEPTVMPVALVIALGVLTRRRLRRAQLSQ